MKTKLLGLLLLASSSMFAGGRFFFGFGVGGGPGYGYYPPPPPVAYVTPAPGPGYSWVDGYYYPAGPRRAWRPGYWAPRPFVGARWVAPRYYGNRYSSGYWRR